MQETTREESEPKAVMSSDQQELQDLRAKCEAQQRRLKFLESFLSQKLETTKSDYERLKPYFDGLKNWIMEIFFDDFPSRLSAEDVTEKFIAKHPRVNVSNLQRRIYELHDDGRLCRSYDEVRKRVVFYLCLFPDDKASGKGSKSQEHNNKNLGESHESNLHQNSEVSQRQQSSKSFYDSKERERQES